MENIKDFKIEHAPIHKIVIVTTSDPDYEMSRTILIEDYPNYGQFTIASGGHCSCYGFDETTWEAQVYTRDELIKVVDGWIEHGYGSESLAAPLIKRYVAGRGG